MVKDDTPFSPYIRKPIFASRSRVVGYFELGQLRGEFGRAIQSSLDKPIEQSLPVIAVALCTARHHALSKAIVRAAHETGKGQYWFYKRGVPQSTIGY